MRPQITLTIKFKGRKMKQKKSVCPSKIKICREGSRVVPNLKKVAKKATKGCRKSYPY